MAYDVLEPASGWPCEVLPVPEKPMSAALTDMAPAAEITRLVCLPPGGIRRPRVAVPELRPVPTMDAPDDSEM